MRDYAGLRRGMSQQQTECTCKRRFGLGGLPISAEYLVWGKQTVQPWRASRIDAVLLLITILSSMLPWCLAASSGVQQLATKKGLQTTQ